MKNYIKLFGITAIALVIGFATLSCEIEPPEEVTLGVPTNVKITVVEKTRIMTVTWDAVANAAGYEIITDSEGCGSGKRIINTKDITAFVYNTANTPPQGTSSVMNSIKNDGSGTQANGSVLILAKNKIQITLMPATGETEKVMASAVTAKVRALTPGGQTIDEIIYKDSAYSSVARVEKANYSQQ
jgi:hypothetical protein